jgi:hypothetical protein
LGYGKCYKQPCTGADGSAPSVYIGRGDSIEIGAGFWRKIKLSKYKEYLLLGNRGFWEGKGTKLGI